MRRCGEQAAAVIDERELEVFLRQVLEICLGSLTRQILSVELPNGAGAPWPAYERPPHSAAARGRCCWRCKQVIDLGGRYLAPGFIDADPYEVANICGLPGV